MSSLSERWFGRYSDDYWDLTTTRALLMGLVGNVLYLALFALLLVLAFSLNVVSQTTIARENVTAVGFLLVTVGGVLIGAGSIYRFHTSEGVKERSRKFSFRALAIFGFFGFYWLLASYRPVYAIWFAIWYLVARTLAHIWVYVIARL